MKFEVGIRQMVQLQLFYQVSKLNYSGSLLGGALRAIIPGDTRVH